ncbi:hypothetical protein [Lacrimispora sp.]|uniref:hypothetical protein n=1 Tax=Lacrimispora sp. TaxID=2719234 RepID=UPI0028A803B2|nr:hypothetical protein [Lacrimispora sp.]
MYFIIAGLIILIIGAFIVAGSIFFDPAFYRFAPNDPIGKYLPAGIVVLCLIWVFIIFPRLPKALQTEGTLYEKGIVLSLQRGMGQFTRDLECSFDEIKGIKHYVVRYYVNGIIPSGKNLAFFVCMKQQYQAYTGNNRIKSYNQTEPIMT